MAILPYPHHFAQISEAHSRAVRMLGYALTLNTREAWSGLSVVLAVRLSPPERIDLATSALLSMPSEDRAETAAAVLRPAGAPLPAFVGGLGEARWWASLATREELVAFGLMAFEAMSDRDRARFIRQITGAGRAPI